MLKQALLRTQILMLCLFGTGIICITPAHADFILSPLRHVIEQQSPDAQFTVTNSSDRLIDARVSLLDFRATPDGYELASTDERAQISAAPWLSVHPIRFSLEPGASQIIRLRLRKGFDLPPGELRSHLYIEADPARNRVHKVSSNTSNGGLGLDMRLGISVPVIVKPAHTVQDVAKVEFEETKLQRDTIGQIVVDTHLTSAVTSSTRRSYSYYGAVCAEHRASGATTVTSYGCMENIALYPDTDYRNLRVPLNLKNIPAGDLKLIYKGRAEYSGKILAIKTFRIDG